MIRLGSKEIHTTPNYSNFVQYSDREIIIAQDVVIESKRTLKSNITLLKTTDSLPNLLFETDNKFSDEYFEKLYGSIGSNFNKSWTALPQVYTF